MLIFSTLLLFFIPLSPLILSLGLVALSLVSVCYLLVSNSITTLLGITFLLVYLGSLIIISCYICAVIPNTSLPSSTLLISHTSSILMFFLISITSSFLLSQSPSYSNPRIESGSFLFSKLGLPFFFIITFLLVVILNSASSCTSPQNPLRS